MIIVFIYRKTKPLQMRYLTMLKTDFQLPFAQVMLTLHIEYISRGGGAGGLGQLKRVPGKRIRNMQKYVFIKKSRIFTQSLRNFVKMITTF